MKTIFLTVCSIIFFTCSGLINAQVDTVYLNDGVANLVESSTWAKVVSPGDSIVFKSNSGDLAIYISDAYTFLDIKEANLELWFTESDPISEVFKVIGPSGEWPPKTIKYTVYSCDNDDWPDSPPRIIVVQ